MNSAELRERTAEAKGVVESEIGKLQVLGAVPGTGWGEGVSDAFKERLRIPYSKLNVPGSELVVEGHEKVLRVGTLGDNRDAVILGRVHPNEDITHPDLRQGMSVVIGALEDCLEGLLVTNGVGTLHGRVGKELGWLQSMVITAILDVMGYAGRRRRQEPINVGDIAIVDDVKTSLVGPMTPLGAGQFIDFYHGGIHRDGDKYFNTVREAVTEVQGRCPKAQARFIAGPQFEGPADKVEFRAKGDDVIGMSGIQELLKCTELAIPAIQLVLATNGPFEMHSHEGNQGIGKSNRKKAAAILRLLADTWPRKAAV